MALHDDLLEQAHHLAHRERTRPRQASLRRAVSAAYDALLHLLIDEAVSLWKIGEQRPQLARMFEHRKMKSASDRVGNPRLVLVAGQDPAAVVHLKRIASAFARLYEERQVADYDVAKRWSRTAVLRWIDLASAAFESMRAIREETITQDYLLSLFLKERG